MSDHRCEQYALCATCMFCGSANTGVEPRFDRDCRQSDAVAMWTDWRGPGETIGHQDTPVPSRVADVLNDPAFERVVLPALGRITDEEAHRLLCDLIRVVTRPRWWQFYRRTIRPR